MTTRRPCPPAPGPLEDYAQQLDVEFSSLAQRRGFRGYLQGLLLPRDRNKTLTGLVGAEPITGAQHREVQRLQWFLSESTWDHEAVNQQRIALLQADPATVPHAQGVLVIDDTADRKDGSATAHVARQYLGSVGKTDNGIVAVTSLWADGRCYWPLHVVPYTPASPLARGRSDPGFWTKPQLAAELVAAARQARIPFRVVVADCFYGDNTGFVEALGRAGVAFVLALKPRKGVWAPDDAAHTPVRRPASLAGVGRVGRGRGGASSGASAMATPRPGGPPTRCLAAGDRTGTTGWWWPPPTRSGCRGFPPGTCSPTWLARPHAAPSRPSSARSLPPMGCATGWSRPQAGQGRARLGRLPGQRRPGDPAALDAGVLGVQLLLARRPGPSGGARRRARATSGHGGAARGGRAGGPATSRSGPPPPCRWPAWWCRGRRHDGGCVAGWPRWCGCSAAGVDGRPARRPGSCGRRLAGSWPDGRPTSTSRRNQQTTVR